MVMNWLHNGNVVDGNTLRPPKDLMLTGSGLLSPPELFRVYQVYSPAAEALRGFLNQVQRRPVVTLGVKKSKNGVFKAENHWMLPAPYGLHFASQFAFSTEDPDELSPRIRSHRLGSFQLGGESGGSFNDPTQLVPIGVDGKATISATFLAAIDPIMTLRVLTGYDLFRMVFEDAFSENPIIPVMPGGGLYALEFASQVYRSQGSMYRPPPGWAFSMTPSRFEADEDSETDVVLTVNAPSPGLGLLAFHAAVEGDPSEGVASDILQITADASGRVFARTGADFGPAIDFL